jgi:hypothetical protein
MKKAILLFSMLMSINLSAQSEIITQKIFVRVYDLDGKKIGKGRVYAINDSLLVLNKNAKKINIYPEDIGKIKTKRSGGHNFLVGASSGVLVGAILGSVNPPTDSSGGTFTWAGDSAGDELAVGAIYGLLSGTIVGGISALFKNPKKFIIDGSPEKWNDFVQQIRAYR